MKGNKIHNFIYSILFTIISFLWGCSVTGKDIYFAPIGGENWVQEKKKQHYEDEYPDDFYFRCIDMQFNVSATLVEGNTYSIGPPLLPVFPTFGVFDIHPGEHGINIFLSVKGYKTGFRMKKANIIMTLEGGGEPLAPKEFKKRDVPEIEDILFYRYTFDINWKSVQSFKIHFGDIVKGCKIPDLKFKRITDYEFHPAVL